MIQATYGCLRIEMSRCIINGEIESECFGGGCLMAKNTCDYLEEHFGENTIIKIRQACRCNDGKSIAKKIEK